MNLSELKAKLEGNNVPKDMYHFGWTTNETICIEYRNGGWEVYSSERGSKILIKRFKREDYACEYFYKAVMNDYRQYQEYILHYKNFLDKLLCFHGFINFLIFVFYFTIYYIMFE